MNFTANYLVTRRHDGIGTRSVFDSGHGDFVGPFETIAEALAAGIAAQDEALAFDPYSYERGWVMVEDAAREVVLDATADQVEAVKLGMQDAAGLLAFRAAQEARWAAEAAETRRVLALSADLDAEIPF